MIRKLVLPSLLLSLILWMAAAPRAVATLFSNGGSEFPSLSSLVGSCPTKVEKFRNSVTWVGSANRILIEADSACGSKAGNLLSLENVRLTIQGAGKTYASLVSISGAYSSRQHEFLLGKTSSVTDQGCLRGVDVLVVDLKTGELRTPGRRIFLKAKRPLHCKEGERAQRRQYGS